MGTYAQDMMKKHGVPFDPTRVKRAAGFKFGDRVEMVSDAESWQSGVKKGEQGTVWAITAFNGQRSVSPDPQGKMIYVKWDNGKVASVWRGTIAKSIAAKRLSRAERMSTRMGVPLNRITQRTPPLR